jgi:hypothetical protein
MSSTSDLMKGPDPLVTTVSKRAWEGNVQAWRHELATACAIFYPVGFYGYVVD